MMIQAAAYLTALTLALSVWQFFQPESKPARLATSVSFLLVAACLIGDVVS